MSKNRSFLLILVSLALGVLVWLDNRPTSDPQATAPPVQTQPPAPAAQAEDAPAPQQETGRTGPGGLQMQNPLASFDKAKLKDWVERPLFAASRKRPATQKVVERPVVRVKPKRAAPSYDLLGVVLDGDRAIALLRKKGDGRSFRVEVGDMIGGWRVSKLEPASVVLEREDGTSQTLPLTPK